jgi:type I restriction enzyme S subunit
VRGIPTGWKVAPLEQLVEILDGRRVPVSAPERAKRPGDVPYYGAAGKVGTIDDALFNEPLLLLGEDGVQFFDPLKPKAYQIRGRSWVNNHAHVLRVRRGTEPTLLEHYLNQFDYRGFANGTTRLKLTQAAMRRIPVALPELAEQRRIVAILEEHLSDLDNARGLLESSRRRSIVMLNILRDRIVSGAAFESVGPNGLAPGWEWATPADVASDERGSIVIGPFGSDLKTSDYREAGVPLIFVRNVRAAYFGADKAKFVSLEKARSLSSHEARKGDVLVTKMGDPPGDATVYSVDEPGIVTADVIRMRPSGNVDPFYLATAINSTHVRRQVLSITSGVAQKKVSLSRFRSGVRLPIPPLDLQHRAMAVLTPVTESIDRLDAEVARATTMEGSMRRSLLAAALSGRLTGRGSDRDVIQELANEGCA